MPEPHRREVILVVHDLAGGGGMETVLRRQLPDLAARFALTVVSCSINPELAGKVTWVRIRVPTRLTWLKMLSFWVVAGARVRSLTHSQSSGGGAPPLLWAIGGIIPQRVDAISVHFCHAGYVDKVGWTVGVRGLRRVNAGWSRLLSLALERHSYRPTRVRQLLSVSTGLRDEVAAHYPGIPIAVTPNGVDMPPIYAPKSTTRRKDGTLRLLFVGGDWARKGLPSVIRAITQVDGVILSVVGEGPESLGPALAKECGVTERVTFHPWTSNVSQHYIASDALVLASHYETFGMVVFEAAAHGLVPIATPVHGAADLVEHDVSGFIIPAEDVPALATILAQLRDEPKTASRVGEEARMRARRFTWEASIDSVEEALALLWSQQP